MTEMALNRSPLAPAISPVSQYNRRRVRAAGCTSRRLSSTGDDLGAAIWL
jgi:hypothetical protein